MKPFILLIFITNLITFQVFAQSSKLEKELVDSLAFYESQLGYSHTYEEKEIANKQIIKILTKLCKQEKSIDFVYDTLEYISVLTSNDKKLRVFSWVNVISQGNYEYFGIIQSFDSRNNLYKINILEDKSMQIGDPMKKSLTPEKWYGARYYQLIETKQKSKKYYTILGWKGLDLTRNSMVIESISLKSNGEISFGNNVFELNGSSYFEKYPKPRRVIFTFSSEAKMTLSYEQQTILKKVKEARFKDAPIQLGFNAQQKEVRKKPKYRKIIGKMIVFDQLMPLNPEMEGIYAFYIPKINVIDALHFEKGKWVYYSDVDAKNPTVGNQRKTVIDYELIEEIIED